MKSIYSIASALILLALLMPVCAAFSQTAGDTAEVKAFRGVVNFTNKGISTIPSFTLGKPAVIFDLALGKKKLTFEPQLRFALEGKPWSFLFWWRYRLVQDDKFQVRVGAHPALNFTTWTVTRNGVEQETIVARRFWAGELATGYSLTKNVNIGIYYLYGYGVESSTARNTHFIDLTTRFTSADLLEDWIVTVNPQVYYLISDDENGYYFTANFALARRGLPITLGALINKTLRTDIAGDDFLWNVSLIYSY